MPHKMKPESLMMTHGYDPKLSEGAVKTPMFLTSTFAFDSAEEGKAFFELAYGLREKNQGEELGLIYSRINNPNLEILEDRLALWDDADGSAVFESGMSAISTVLLEFLKPGDLLLFSNPTYGGTDHFIREFLTSIGVHFVAFDADHTKDQIIQSVEKTGKSDRLRMVYIETPANPNNDMIDIKMCREIADHFTGPEHKVQLAVDNTYMGPVWSSPLAHGADIVIYSATKYIGGHSDIIAGAVSAHKEEITRIKVLRTFLGNMASPHTCWLLLRSLETLKIRMDTQAANAAKVAHYLANHKNVVKVNYLGHIKEGEKGYETFTSQYTSGGAMISFYVDGGEKEAFSVLNHMQLIKLAVSLGSTESLAQHPATMTHAGVDHDLKERLGVTSNMIRLSVGVENWEDLTFDLGRALDATYDK